MKKSYLYILFFLFLTKINFAQDIEYNFSGYFEHQFFPQSIRGKTYLQDYNKLRVNFSAEISEDLTVTANYIYKINHGATNFNSFDFIPTPVVNNYINSLNIDKDEIKSKFGFSLENDNVLNDIFITYYSDFINIRVGKQQLPWGSGYAWNPTDLFNSKNIQDPLYEKPGVNAVKTEISFSQMGIITAIFNVENHWKNSTKAVKIKDHFYGFDISVAFVKKEIITTNYQTFKKKSENQKMFGLNFSGPVLGIGTWFEMAINKMEISPDFTQFVAGVDYTFDNELYLITEYFRNGKGKTDYKKYSFNNWMNLLGTKGENLGKDYLYLGGSYPITELIDWKNYIILNLNDESGMLYPWFDYSFNDNTVITLVGYIPFGKDETEFGSFGIGGFARIKVYF